MVNDEVVHHDVSDDAFHYLAWHSSEGYGTVVGWVGSGAFFEDGGKEVLSHNIYQFFCS